MQNNPQLTTLNVKNNATSVLNTIFFITFPLFINKYDFVAMKAIFKMIIDWLSFLFNSKHITSEPVIVENSDTEENENVEEKPEQEPEEEPEQEPEIKKEEYKKMVIILDNGHAKSTPGKRSPILPDGSQFFEYEFSRDIVRRIAEKLDVLGIQYRIIVPEVNEDIGLSKRAARANAICDEFGAANCFFISIHANAAGDGSCWKNARGWSIYTTKGNTNSDKYATIVFEEADKMLPNFNLMLRRDMTDGDPDFEENFTVIYKTKCPAVLTENLFMDNLSDVRFLMSDEGRDIIAQLHVNAIKRICKKD